MCATQCTVSEILAHRQSGLLACKPCLNQPSIQLSSLRQSTHFNQQDTFDYHRKDCASREPQRNFCAKRKPRRSVRNELNEEVFRHKGLSSISGPCHLQCEPSKLNPSVVRIMQTSNLEPVAAERNAKSVPTITAFICANCSRAGRVPSSTNRPAPSPPDFCWPLPVRELLVPCTGRLQPEHILKAFEVGADVVCMIGCAEDNCHTLEGSRRCARRVKYVGDLLDQIGIGRERLWHFRLPGSAREDRALGVTGEPDLADQQRRESSQLSQIEPELRALRQELADRIAELRPSPLHNSQWAGAIDYPVEEDDQSED